MEILAHRGWWRSQGERNSPEAISRALDHGFGIETDVRDLAGGLVVSHDPPPADHTYLWADLVQQLDRSPSRPWVAVNVKADGLAASLANAFAGSAHQIFLFDMSVPDMRACLAAGLPVFTRQSEYEQDPAFYPQSIGVWLDAFESDWAGNDLIAGHLRSGKHVALVSPELHGRSHHAAWERWREIDHAGTQCLLMVCTDFPDEAKSFFNE